MEHYGSWLLVLIALISLAFLGDKLLLWMEDRGWVYYRKKKATSSGTANALLALHEIFEPGVQQIVEERKQEEDEEEEEDDGKTGGARGTSKRRFHNNAKFRKNVELLK